jgi:uncharacterized membrane protein HdeD (DUF308 family)
MLGNPLVGAVALTLMVGTILVAAGIFRSIASIVMQYPNWGWHLLSGIVSLVAGGILLSRLGAASLWFIGLFVGIDLIFHGISWIAFSLRVHRLAGELQVTDTDQRRAA